MLNLIFIFIIYLFFNSLLPGKALKGRSTVHTFRSPLLSFNLTVLDCTLLYLCGFCLLWLPPSLPPGLYGLLSLIMLTFTNLWDELIPPVVAFSQMFGKCTKNTFYIEHPFNSSRYAHIPIWIDTSITNSGTIVFILFS